jgi:predicted enzyme related to lactoylglutathione lyase
MNYRLEHVAIECKDLKASIEFYRKFFGGTPTEVRTGAAGYPFCFIKINGEVPIQLMESKEPKGVHHYGFVTDDIEQAVKDFKARGAKVLRESHDVKGKLTTVFLQDPNGLQLEVRIPR